MKYLFFMMPAFGHMNPTLTVAEELVRRGEEVVYYITDDFTDSVKKAGAEIRVIDPIFNPLHYFQKKHPEVLQSFTKPPIHLMTQYMNEARLRAHELIDQVKSEKADVAIYDPMCVWGKEMIYTLDLPAATFYSSFAFHKEAPTLQKWVEQHLHPEEKQILHLFTVAEKLNIVSNPKQFQYDAEFFDHRYAFVGPLISDRHVTTDLPLDRLNSQPTLFISLGTILSNAEFYQNCFEAFGDTHWQVILNVGPRTRTEELDSIPKNFIIRPFVPQLEVLKHTDVFISHGGMNSIMEALWFGVPTVAIPQSSDQPLVAERLTQLGLGESIQPDQVTPEQLRESVDRVSQSETVRVNLQAMSHSMRKANPVQQTADLLQSLAKQQAVV
ncbi:nucleotide disphospho-sugar-binding domain-containing protein [Thermoactinomyces sp. DSM 45892]|uniref:nucleotide disphospho-sugar-binding domain-containing protein n=1 Tax=Thermoactinomyces sp. DSM 45892 TaxID=1882753 RepID=UPI0008969A8F|nr:nucleotide disphospho-sugar-binding domain-containing protein [Thermoactinomyces sp. DSM 45892]SDY04578.1 glycosyltransferase, MGT family [Thermoactinomyces sp. DSM 45892]